jgi:lysophospholipase L1-like esterase
VKRVACLGESSTFGYFVSDGEEWARLLEAQLRDRGIPTEVLNAGVPGYNLCQHPTRWEQVRPFHPDLVILYLGWNDLPSATSVQPDAERFVRKPIAPAWRRDCGNSALYGLLFHRLLGARPQFGPSVMESAAPTPAGAAAFRTRLRKLLAAIRPTPVLVVAQLHAGRVDLGPDLAAFLRSAGENLDALPTLGGWLRAELKAAAADATVPFFDANTVLPADRTLLADQIHLTRAGEARLADALSEPVAAALR